MAPIKKTKTYFRFTLWTCMHAVLRVLSPAYKALRSSKVERKDSEAIPEFRFHLKHSLTPSRVFGPVALIAAFLLTASSFATSELVQAQNGKAESSNTVAAPDASLEVGNTIYRVRVNTTGPAVGRYTAVTGASHPAGAGLQVLFGGTPDTSFNSIRSFTTTKTYVQGSNFTTVVPAPIVGATDLDPYAQPATTTATSVQNRWILPGDVTAPDKLEITQTITVVGSTIADSMILIQTMVKNNDVTAVSTGIRYLWDYQISGDDGPTFQEQTPDGLVRVGEVEFPFPVGFATYKMTNNEGAPSFNILGSAATGGTAPDKLQYADWPSSRVTAYDYTVVPGRDVATSGLGNNDSAVLYYWNRNIPAGGTVTVSGTLLRLETACVLTCPPAITRSNDQGQCGAVVTYTTPTSGVGCTVNCSPSTGSFFPIGTTTVTCTADSNPPPAFAPSASSSCSFTVTVLDTQAPSIACPTNVNVQCTGTSGPKYTLPTVTDNCPGAAIVCIPPPDFAFGPGTTGVNCEATDQGGNTARCSFTVTVKDTTPPTITSCLAPPPIPNLAGACSVLLPDVTGSVTATDNCTGVLVKTQSPPTGPNTFLEAGKTHVVTVVVQDAAGNQSSCALNVTVAAAPAAAIEITPAPPAAVDLGSVKLFGATKKKKVKPTVTEGTFTLTNPGCTPITVTPKAINRFTDGGKMNPNDGAFFTVFYNGQPFTSANAPTVVKGAPATLTVRYNPSVPALSSCGSNPPSSACLNASNVLPSSFRSIMSFNGTDKTVNFDAAAAKGVKLIDSTNSSAANGVAQLCRSGDQFTVTYFIYDSDTSDVKSVKYEFLDSSGGVVKVIDNVDLAGPISKAGLVNGMSFKAQQTFSGASDNDNVTKVRVTLTGAAGSTSTAESSGNSGCGTTTQAFLEREFTAVLLPARRLRAVKP